MEKVPHSAKSLVASASGRISAGWSPFFYQPVRQVFAIREKRDEREENLEGKDRKEINN